MSKCIQCFRQKGGRLCAVTDALKAPPEHGILTELKRLHVSATEIHQSGYGINYLTDLGLTHENLRSELGFDQDDLRLLGVDTEDYYYE